MDITSQYRQKGEKPRRNKLGHKLFVPVSRYVMYNKNEKLWIPVRRRNYLLWFKFLQHCEEDKTRTVDWSKYRGWGGSNYIRGVSFTQFFDEKWVKLFSIKNRGDTPKFNIENSQHYNSYRLFLLVYEYNLKYPDLVSYEKAKLLREREYWNRYPVESLTENTTFSTSRGRKEIQKVWSRWKKGGHQIMDNVCEGKFP
jgi:hypothetical protein